MELASVRERPGGPRGKASCRPPECLDAMDAGSQICWSVHLCSLGLCRPSGTLTTSTSYGARKTNGCEISPC